MSPPTLQIIVTETEYHHHADSYDGVCLACGEWTAGGCEPDAHGRRCEMCDARQVAGAEEALTLGRLTLAEG